MPNGTLRDQIIYPDTIGNMKRKGYKDDDLRDFLDKVRITFRERLKVIAEFCQIFIATPPN